MASFCSHLVEAVLASVTDIYDLDNFGHQPQIELVALTEFRLKVRTSSEDQTSNINLVVGYEVLDSQLGYLANVVVSFFVTKTGETKRRLATATMLFGQIDGELVHDFTRITS